MKRLPLSSLSAVIVDDCVFVLTKNGKRLTLLLLDINSGITDKFASFKGSKGFILGVKESGFLICIDDKVYLVRNDGCEVVLKSQNPENTFWHLTEADGKIFVQEYGQSPTGIYISKDLESWRKVITNIELDKCSKHFHYIAWDPYRRWLIATLGDGCLTRVVYSEDLGQSWKPLYRGAWQFVPIVPLKDEIVLGMDSGIAKGGVGIYYPSRACWDFIFLRWYDKNVRFIQMCDLMYVNGRFWVASLGTPQALIISRNLRDWHVIHFLGGNEAFNPYMRLGEGNNFMVCSTGNNLLVIEKSELDSFTETQTVVKQYDGYLDRLKGYGFSLKRKFLELSTLR